MPWTLKLPGYRGVLSKRLLARHTPDAQNICDDIGNRIINDQDRVWCEAGLITNFRRAINPDNSRAVLTRIRLV